MATARQGGKAGRKWIREPGDLPAGRTRGRDGRTRQTMITLVLGGARSGKSEHAEGLARRAESAGRTVIYVATAAIGSDPDFAVRIQRHRDRRPESWLTEEPGGGLVAYLQRETSEATLLIDSLGTWVASFEDFEVDTQGLCTFLTARTGDAIVVSEEVGLGVHPSTEVGGRFRDALGVVNQAVAATADHVHLVVAGRVLLLERGA